VGPPEGIELLAMSVLGLNSGMMGMTTYGKSPFLVEHMDLTSGKYGKYGFNLW